MIGSQWTQPLLRRHLRAANAWMRGIPANGANTLEQIGESTPSTKAAKPRQLTLVAGLVLA